MQWKNFWKEHLRFFADWPVGRADPFAVAVPTEERSRLVRIARDLKERGAEIEKAAIRAVPGQTETKREDLIVRYRLCSEWLVRQNGDFYTEEKVEERQALLRGDRIVSDAPDLSKVARRETEPPSMSAESAGEEAPRGYDRRAAVRYAELWWNRRNPAYPQVENDCTNYISQCLYAGGVPMWGAPVRSRGWWHSRTNWSFTWAVANSFRWYLSSRSNVIGTEEKEHADQLVPGDVICYDFEGDGHWNHNTMVTAIDPSGQPLVNAHTYDARARHWAYTDSPAWTPSIQYKFFHIKNEV
ncbi:MAG: amidase domain-containing protein [Sporolactobacillus sp.]|jgi:hypothetical protein|nr:amidase domain-containing protein [Sporolactobacillus sp.]